MENDGQIKVVLLGDSGVGKSSILDQFLFTDFKHNTDSTIGGSFKSKEIEVGEKKVKLNIWDTAGQERYYSLTKMYCRGAGAAILVYDITNRESFENLTKWIQLLNEADGKNVYLALVGNKEDLVMNESVDLSEAKEFARKIGAVYKKTSAKNNVGIDGLFKSIACRDSQGCSLRKSSVKLSRCATQTAEKNKKKKGCC